MSKAISILYDAPGPKAKQRNILYSIVFVLALAAVAWWIVTMLADKHQLDAAKWKPFVTDSRVWTTYLLPGLQGTVIAALLSVVIALPIGAIFGIARLSEHVWIRVPASVVVEFFRAIPVLILMVFANYFFVHYSSVPLESVALFAIVTGLVLYNGSVLAEVVRAGILSLPKGQAEAAAALGMRKTQTMTLIQLPQAVTAMLPAIVSQLVVIVKDTALGGYILGYAELLTQSRTVSNAYSNTIPTLVFIALVFIVVNFALSQLASWLENKLRNRTKGNRTTVNPEMVEEQAPGMKM
ncbi:amino acid ABC transporter permease [Labedaea rhizosphaerae]|uniref:Glutamate transport system permease protein n=1 Tax=Labedaea rhizosphaerae TaxID=598644 RepID=A0A4R6RSF6_LABRH|nr:amino acid ABC transporter permease [Labedaea rhizosphaerae]TDP89185.1 glutamate transport system permease protein [Labedaea rhizosphaerae]